MDFFKRLFLGKEPIVHDEVMEIARDLGLCYEEDAPPDLRVLTPVEEVELLDRILDFLNLMEGVSNCPDKWFLVERLEDALVRIQSPMAAKQRALQILNNMSAQMALETAIRRGFYWRMDEYATGWLEWTFWTLVVVLVVVIAFPKVNYPKGK